MRSFRSQEDRTQWHTFTEVSNAAIDSMDGSNNDLLALVDAAQVHEIKHRVQSVQNWVDFGSIFSDFSKLLLTLPLPPQRLPALEQAEADLERELFSVYVPKPHLPLKKDACSPRKVQMKDGLYGRVIGKQFHLIEDLLNESCQRLCDASTVGVVGHLNQDDSWEEIIDSSSGNGTADAPPSAAVPTTTPTSPTSSTPTSSTSSTPSTTAPTSSCKRAKRNLVPSDILKCAASRTLGGGDAYFIVQQLFATSMLLITPSHSTTPGAIEIMIYDSGVVSIRTKSFFDIRSVEHMDGKEMVEITAEHIINIDLFQNCMRRHLIIQSPSSQLAVDISDLMGL